MICEKNRFINEFGEESKSRPLADSAEGASNHCQREEQGSPVSQSANGKSVVEQQSPNLPFAKSVRSHDPRENHLGALNERPDCATAVIDRNHQRYLGRLWFGGHGTGLRKSVPEFRKKARKV
jgi:hypothetical protein